MGENGRGRIQLILVAFEYSVCVWEIYALEYAVFFSTLESMWHTNQKFPHGMFKRKRTRHV